MMSAPMHVSDSDFENFVLKSGLPVIVDFWAPWCAPCRMIAPLLENFAAEYDGKVLVAKVNTDENPQWAMEYGVQSIPTLLFIRNGEVDDRIIGAVPASVIRTKIETLLGTSVHA